MSKPGDSCTLRLKQAVPAPFDQGKKFEAVLPAWVVLWMHGGGEMDGMGQWEGGSA